MTDQQDKIHYHHFSFTFPEDELSQRIQDVRFVLVAGCARRARSQALYLSQRLVDNLDCSPFQIDQLTSSNSRFSLFKVGPVLVGDHGMGAASISIALHELLLMCRPMWNKLTLIRFGTCGGIGINPGTICITNRALDPLFQDFYELKVCGQLVRRPCTMDLRTAQLLFDLAVSKPYPNSQNQPEVRIGATVAANDFYEEQGRTNGAICEHSQEDKMRFLNDAASKDVINIEMESTCLASMCLKVGVSFAVVCVALNNRLESNSANLTCEQLSNFEERLFWLNLTYIQHKLTNSSN